MGNFYHQPGFRRGDVYGIRCGEFTKIGHAQDVNDRMVTMKLYNPYPIELVFLKRAAAAMHFERKMHELLAAHAIGREWFKVTIDQVWAAANVAQLHADDVIKQAKQADRVYAEKLRKRRQAVRPAFS